jgi:hypothetical protein
MALDHKSTAPRNSGPTRDRKSTAPAVDYPFWATLLGPARASATWVRGIGSIR